MIPLITAAPDIPGTVSPASLDPATLLRTAAADTLTRTAGPCLNPVRLARTRTTIHRTTGRAEHHTDVFTARSDTRRASTCPAYSTLYKYDTYNLIATGLRGGKNTPAARRRAPAPVRHPHRTLLRTRPPQPDQAR